MRQVGQLPRKFIQDTRQSVTACKSQTCCTVMALGGLHVDKVAYTYDALYSCNVKYSWPEKLQQKWK